MLVRIGATVILLIFMLAAPFWVFAVLGILAMVYFPFYLETVVLALVSDLLYGAPRPVFFDIVFVSFLASLICFAILEVLKRKLRLHGI